MTNYQQVLTASTLIHTGRGLLAGLVISAAPDTPAAHVTCYDNTAASGTKVFEAYLDEAGSSQPFTLFFADRFAPRFATGLYISLTGAVVNVWASGE